MTIQGTTGDFPISNNKKEERDREKEKDDDDGDNDNNDASNKETN